MEGKKGFAIARVKWFADTFVLRWKFSSTNRFEF